MTEIDEILEAIKALKAEVGPNAGVNVHISERGISTWLYPRSKVSSTETIYGEGATWRDHLEHLRAENAKRAPVRAEGLIKDMALAIVRITFETGGCTDAQLRGDGFDAADVAKYGQGAVETANDMAEAGPFSLTIQGAGKDVAAA